MYIHIEKNHILCAIKMQQTADDSLAPIIPVKKVQLASYERFDLGRITRNLSPSALATTKAFQKCIYDVIFL